ncbi:MAG TPA: penicillin-binding protein activator [Gammaproteobacteria bacterium]|nr:penicillin-binding protein activator [Gammaproteobacteria bacterium]
MGILPILHREARRMQGKMPLRTASRACAPLLLLAFIAGCAVTPAKQTPVALEAQAQRSEQEGRYADAAQIYEQLAAGATAPAQATARVEFRVSAAEDWLQAGNGQRSWALLGEIKEKNLYPALAARIEILKAGLDLAGHQPQAALAHLRFPVTGLPDEIRAKILLVSGQIHAALGDLPAMVEDWSQRENYLGGNAAAVRANHQLIWQALSAAYAPLVAAALPPKLSPTARGWLELADIARTSWQQPEKFAARMQTWQNQYAQHPAVMDVMPDLLAKQQALAAYPPRLAVLLPLSGNYQSQGDAVRDGLLAAYYQTVGTGQAPAVSFYDAGSTADEARTAYEKAVADGANMVLGPLLKDAVSGIASFSSLPAPVLALNYLDPGKTGAAGLYQFGLLPEGEAEQAADRAIAEGRTRAVAFVSADDFGTRMLNAFSARFSQGGGTLLGVRTYAAGADTQTKPYEAPITQLLNLDASGDREAALASTLGTHLEFEPRRREDVQFIFLAAKAEDARQIQPQIAYYHADDVPVYSTSRVYDLDSNVDNSVLNGITFDDMPWTLEDAGSVAELRALVAKTWPNNFGGNSRLYALGFDAYRLVPLLYNTHGISEPVQGVTGLLSLGADGRVLRRLDWAEFDDGEPQMLPAVSLPPAAVVSAAGTP